MVLKRGKAHKKQAKLAALQSSVEPSSRYRPPARERLEAEEWIEELDGLLFKVYAWYFHKKRQTEARKLADFHIQVFQMTPDFPARRRLVASADCLNHGTLHFHDEVADPKHVSRKDVLPLTAPTDVEIAFVQVYDRLKAFAATIISREGKHHA